jgi:hypothetical protein
MSRISTEQQIVRPPSNNVYTVLAIVGTVVSLLGLVLLISRAKELLGASGIM